MALAICKEDLVLYQSDKPETQDSLACGTGTCTAIHAEHIPIKKEEQDACGGENVQEALKGKANVKIDGLLQGDLVVWNAQNQRLEKLVAVDVPIIPLNGSEVRNTSIGVGVKWVSNNIISGYGGLKFDMDGATLEFGKWVKVIGQIDQNDPNAALVTPKAGYLKANVGYLENDDYVLTGATVTFYPTGEIKVWIPQDGLTPGDITGEKFSIYFDVFTVAH